MGRRWVGCALAAVTVLGLLIRLDPLRRFGIWGSDTGEYFLLTERLVTTGTLTAGYNGWGIAYPWFPGMEVLTGAFSTVGNVPLLDSLLRVTPAAATLSIPLVFLIAKDQFDDARVALAAGGFLSVAIAHVYATSHPMPGALGDLLALTALLLAFRADRDRMAGVGFVLVAGALVVTHHLSTFFVLLPLLGIMMLREILRNRTNSAQLRTWILLTLVLCLLTLSYWFGVASPFSAEVLGEALPPLSPGIVILGGLAGIAGTGALLVVVRRRSSARYVPRFPDLERCRQVAGLVGGITIVGMALTLFVAVPGTLIQTSPLALIVLGPMLIMGLLTGIGTSRAEFSPNGFVGMLWLGVLSLVLAFGIATGSHLLIPFRQLQYFAVPMVILAAAGIAHLLDIGVTRPGGSKIAAGAVALLIVVAIPTGYPPREVVGGFEEGTTQAELDAVAWMAASAEDGATVATDHRLSSMLFGFAGLNATWDSAGTVLTGDLQDAMPELHQARTPSGSHRIDYVLVTEPMRRGVALKQWETAPPISPEALAKFDDAPFLKVYATSSAGVVRVAA